MVETLTQLASFDFLTALEPLGRPTQTHRFQTDRSVVVRAKLQALQQSIRRRYFRGAIRRRYFRGAIHKRYFRGAIRRRYPKRFPVGLLVGLLVPAEALALVRYR